MIQNRIKLEKNEEWIKKGFGFLVILLLAVVLLVPEVLNLMHRADAQVALGHAKSVRLALKLTGQECYSKNIAFCDSSSEGGVTKDIYEEIITLSAVPGDFWALKSSKDGYTVEEFVYRENDFTVWYTNETKSYKVYYEKQMTDRL